MPSIKFEVGKTYKTRNSRAKLEVIFIDSLHLFLINPDLPDAGRVVIKRNLDGKSTIGMTDCDLVEEYVEPVVEKHYINVVTRPSNYLRNFGALKVSCAMAKQSDLYTNNRYWEQMAQLELIVSDGKLTEVKIINTDDEE